MRRVLVVGLSGSGKTTAAREIARRLGLPFHELDAVLIGPGWATPPDAVQRVERIATDERWVVDSWAPPDLRPLLWSRADTVVWLDYPRRVVLPRLLRRSLRRSWHRQPVFGGNVERWRDWGRADHPVRHAVATFDERRRTIAGLLEQFPQAEPHRFTDPARLGSWLSHGPQC